jgi:ubiquinone biosynthesis protein
MHTSPSLRRPEPARRSSRGAALACFRILDDALRTFEETAWELRGFAARTAEQSRELRDAVRRDGQRISEIWSGWSEDVRRWQSRLARVRSAGWMLAQVSASYRFHQTRRAFLSQAGAAAALEALHARNAARFYRTSCEQGGAFLKLGQMLSARPDLLPRSWIREMSKLQDQAPAVAFEQIRLIVEEDLGAPLGELFERFEEEPIAAASIGQVHRAVTRDGRDVAVKVQRPGIDELVAMDLDLLEIFLESVKSMLPPTDYDTIVEEVGIMLEGELDYRAEARMMNRVADFFAGHPRIRVPRAIESLTGPRVFASSFVPGRKITDALDEWRARAEGGDDEAGRRLSECMGLLLECYVRQVLQAGLFQADPHPGNLLVTDAHELVVLDFGSTRALSDDARRSYLSLLRCFVLGDGAGVGRELGALGFATRSGDDATLQAFAGALLETFRRAAADGPGFAWPSEEEIVERAGALLALSEQDPVVRIPAEFVLLGRVFLTLGGLFQHYRPQVDYARFLAPVLASL